MFTMNAIKLQSIRGTSVLLKEPIVVSLFGRGGGTPRRPDQGEVGKVNHCGGGGNSIAGPVAMAAAKAWLGNNGRKAWGEIQKINVKTVWENVHVCLGGKSGADTAMAAAAKHHSPTTMTTTSSESSVVRLLSFFNSLRRSDTMQNLVPIRKFVWYGQMSQRHAVAAGGISGAWDCLVQSRQRFRMVQEIKTAVITRRRRAVVKEIKSIPVGQFAQRYWRCVAAEATRGGVAAVAAGQKLAANDARAIQDYSADGYTTMNASLRQDDFAEQEQGRVAAVVQALAKLPKYKGKAVYRGTDLPGGTRFEVGAEFQEMAFLSTSRLRKRAFDKPYLFVVHKSSTGVDIMKYSDKRSEQEVLFPPGARFLITAVKTEQGEDRSWKTIVDMEEIAPP